MFAPRAEDDDTGHSASEPQPTTWAVSKSRSLRAGICRRLGREASAVAAWRALRASLAVAVAELFARRLGELEQVPDEVGMVGRDIVGLADVGLEVVELDAGLSLHGSSRQAVLARLDALVGAIG